MAVNYQPEVMLSAMHQVEEKYGVKITFSIEPEPLGTGAYSALTLRPLSLDTKVTFVKLVLLAWQGTFSAQTMSPSLS